MDFKLNQDEKKIVAVYDSNTKTLFFRTNNEKMWKHNKTAALNSPFGRGMIAPNGSHELEKLLENSPTRVPIYEGDEVTIQF